MPSDSPAVPTPAAPGTAAPPAAGVVPGATLAVFRLAAGFTFLAVAMGSVVCATNSGAGCPTWPGCRPDAIAPQWESAPLIEFMHRVVAIGAGPLVLAAALLSLRLTARDPWVRVLPWVALVGTLVAGTFGRLVVLSGIPTWQGGVDLTSALTAMTVMGIAAVRLGGLQATTPAGRPSAAALMPVSRRYAERPVRLAVTAIVVLVAMHVLGLWTAGAGSFTRCMGWPLWQLVDVDRHPMLQVGRLLLAGTAVVLVVGIVLHCAGHDRLRPWAVLLGTLLAAEQALGLVLGGGDASPGLRAASAVAAVALLWALGLFAAAARADRLVEQPRQVEAVTV